TQGGRAAASVKVLPSAWALNSRLWQLAAARAHREDSARARKKPSGASVKVLPAFFKKLAGCRAQFAGGKRPAPTEPAGETRALRPCPYRRAAHEKKLGKQRSVFPGRRRTEKAASRKLGCEPAAYPLRPPLEGTLACRLG